MKLAIFTSNQPRHISLIEEMATIADEVFAVLECNTLFPGLVQDFYNKSPVMQEYFSHVMAAEKAIFGQARYLSSNIRSLSMKDGDLNHLPLATFAEALEADYFIIFGASYIKPPLVDELVARRAINIHMGVSPYYRGSSCNFWAADDDNLDMVGATIHLLSKGLDSGPILFHALPRAERITAFELGMKAVKAAHSALATAIRTRKIDHYQPVTQDRSREIRYTRNRDFTDGVARNYLEKKISPQAVYEKIARRDEGKFIELTVL